jgi:hypothetical protein
MDKRCLHLRPCPPESRGDWRRRAFTVERATAGRVESAETLWFEWPLAAGMPATDDVEPALVAVVLLAMAERRDIVCTGWVSRALLANLAEFMSAWACWCPDLYQPIEITGPVVETAPLPAGRQGAVSAYSGGLDASFTVWSHHARQRGAQSTDIRMAAMVQGFDIPLAEDAAFARATATARRVLAPLGVELVPVRTNFRDVVRINWEHSHAGGLAGVLHLFKNGLAKGIIPSSEPYNRLILPWGSNPITDPLLSGAGYPIVHDGAGFCRTDKAGLLGAWREGCDALRVCWTGEFYDGNCGRCEKCLRTVLNFRVHGLPAPASLPNTVTAAQVEAMDLDAGARRGEWSTLLAAAEAHGVTEDWVAVARRKLARPIARHGLFRRGCQYVSALLERRLFQPYRRRQRVRRQNAEAP